MKGLFKWVGILVGVLVLLIIAASIVVMLVVSKEMIAREMESALHRQVTIDAMHVGLFSVVSGIEVDGVKISNHKTPEQLEGLKGKPVAENDLFAGLKQLSLKLRFLPLLSGHVQVLEFVLYEPVIHVVKYRDGAYNFSDLLQSKPEEKKQEASKKETKPSAPLSADDLPLSLTLGKIGVEHGTVSYLDQSVNQTIEIYDLTFLADSTEIDPAHLDRKNDVQIHFETGIKPKAPLTTGAVKFFDIRVDGKGSIKPFDVKTRLLDPEVTLHVESPQGTLSGVKILEAAQSVKALEPYTGRLSFLQDEITWKQAGVDVWYKAGNVKLSTGRITAQDCGLDFSGTTNLDTKAVDLDLGVELAKGPTQALRSAIEKNVQQQLRGDIAKYVSPEKVTDLVMKRLTNQDGLVFLKYKVTGTTTSPKPTLIEPSVPPLQSLLKEMGVDVAGMAKQAAEKEAQNAIEDATKKFGEDLKKKLKF